MPETGGEAGNRLAAGDGNEPNVAFARDEDPNGLVGEELGVSPPNAGEEDERGSEGARRLQSGGHSSPTLSLPRGLFQRDEEVGLKHRRAERESAAPGRALLEAGRHRRFRGASKRESP